MQGIVLIRHRLEQCGKVCKVENWHKIFVFFLGSRFNLWKNLAGRRGRPAAPPIRDTTNEKTVVDCSVHLLHG